MVKLTDRIVGSILGGAIGDALGFGYEGRLRTGQVSLDCRWQLSDDTQLTLATCEAIISESGLVKPESIAARFAVWHREGRVTGLGASTLHALEGLVAGGHWALVGRKGERAAGNGAAMRIAPLAFCLDPADSISRRLIRDVTRITHHNDEAHAGALAVVIAVREAWTGNWNGAGPLLPTIIDGLPDTRVKDRLVELKSVGDTLSFAELAARFGSSGYVVESVPLALYAVQRFALSGFKATLLEIIEAGGDTDTMASIAGQVMGASIGRENLPQEMLGRLPERAIIERTAVQFAQAPHLPG